MEVWENKSKINAEDILIIHEKLEKLSEQIEEEQKVKQEHKCNILYVNPHFGKSPEGCKKSSGDDNSSDFNTYLEGDMTKYSGKCFRYGSTCWTSEIQRAQKQIAIQHQRFGKIFVPKISKVLLSCGQNEYFSSLEIGLDSKGRYVVHIFI